MNNRAKKSGIGAAFQAKVESKYNEEVASECLVWIHTILKETNDDEEFDVSGERTNFQSVLEDGFILAKLVNVLHPGCISKSKFTARPKMIFKKMELIGLFLDKVSAYGVQDHERFATIDLTESQNLNQVVICLQSLGRKAGAKGHVGLGPQEAEANIRNFTEEQMKAGNNIISLQYGTNKGASQAGMNFGKTRTILD